MIKFIDLNRKQYGVEPICKVIPIAPATYYEWKAKEKNPELRSQRAKSDEILKKNVLRIWNENFQVYGVRKIWKQLNREGIKVARCTTERLMKLQGIQGARRGKAFKNYVDENLADRPRDLVNREFIADRPNQLWVADITYIRTWAGWVFTAFVIDVFNCSIVGWKTSTSIKTGLALDALEQAIHDREIQEPLIHHSDRGVQYLSIKYTERLAEAGLTGSVGTKGDSYDNALAETINGLYKTELIRRKGPWRNMEQVEFATLNWVDWFNKKRIMKRLNYMSPDEYEKLYIKEIKQQKNEAVLT